MMRHPFVEPEQKSPKSLYLRFRLEAPCDFTRQLCWRYLRVPDQIREEIAENGKLDDLTMRDLVTSMYWTLTGKEYEAGKDSRFKFEFVDSPPKEALRQRLEEIEDEIRAWRELADLVRADLPAAPVCPDCVERLPQLLSLQNDWHYCRSCGRADFDQPHRVTVQ